jgi:hypothetical protein
MAMRKRLSLCLVIGALGCNREHAEAPAVSGAASAPRASAASTPESKPAAGCAHTACGEGYAIDATQDPGGCHAGASCTVSLQLSALGDFHINDQYPYRFRADEAPGIEFAGTDPAGKNVFSKSANDWHKTDAKTGVMSVKLSGASAATLAGTFKLSVCSEQNCLIDQPHVSTPVAIR